MPSTTKSGKYEHEGHGQYSIVVEAKKVDVYDVEVSSITEKVFHMKKTSSVEEASVAAADMKAAELPMTSLTGNNMTCAGFKGQ